MQLEKSNKMSIIKELLELKTKNKFQLSDWNKRGLNPSENYVIEKVTEIIDSFLSQLIKVLKTNSVNFKNDFLILLNGINIGNYETEEREFIIDYLFEISNICKVQVSSELNELMYGKGITELETKKELSENKQTKFVDSFKVNEPCQVCEKPLKSLAIEKKEEKQHIAIAECFNCRKLTIVNFPDELKFIDIYNYKVIEKLIYTEENEIKLNEKIKTAHNTV